MAMGDLKGIIEMMRSFTEHGIGSTSPRQQQQLVTADYDRASVGKKFDLEAQYAYSHSDDPESESEECYNPYTPDHYARVISDPLGDLDDVRKASAEKLAQVKEPPMSVGDSPDWKVSDGFPVVLQMYQSILANNKWRVWRILKSGMPTNLALYGDGVDSNHEGMDPVDVAITEGHNDMVKFLLECGYNIQEKTLDGRSCLVLASTWGNLEACKILIENGDRVNLPENTMGDTPLTRSVMRDQPDDNIIKKHARHMTLMNPSKSELYRYTEIIHLLLNHKDILVNKPTKRGITPLNLATRQKHTRVAELLMDHGANIYGAKKKSGGRAGLFDAIYQGSLVCLKLMIDVGTKVNEIRCSQMMPDATPLHVAVANYDQEPGTVKMLLDVGMDINLTEKRGWTALYYAAVCGEYKAMYEILAAGGDINTTSKADGTSLLLALTRRGKMVEVKKLLEMGADPNLENKFGSTPIWASVFTLKANIDFVKLFIRINCDLEITSQERNLYGPETPCRLALELKYLEVLQLLAMAGCKIYKSWLKCERVFDVLEEKGSGDLKNWLYDWLDSPRSLKHICRLAMRERFGAEVHKKVQQLDFPDVLKSYIQMKEVVG